MRRPRRTDTLVETNVARSLASIDAWLTTNSAHDNDVLDAFESWQVAQVQNAIAERQRQYVDEQAAFAERKHQLGPTLSAAAVAGALFLIISFIFLEIKLERDLRTIAQQSREDRRA